MRRLAISSVVVAIGSLTAAPAAVAATNAEMSPSGMVNHSCGLNVSAHQGYLSPPKTGHKVQIGAAVVELRSGATASTVLEWARIRHAKKGDTVWLDWSDDGRRNWHLCGPYRVQTGSDALTRANNTIRGRSMRACGHHAGTTKCTKWDIG